MISKIEYSQQDIKDIEEKIKGLNEQAVNSSPILFNIKETLKDLNTAMDNQSEGVEITPFTKKVRDLSKGLSIHYTEKEDSFSMEYHGMGTRSWSSLLTLKAYILIGDLKSQSEQKVFFPILAIEEPEAHLHPNAQKMLYRQIHEIVGQKIISTHSPYIAASAQLKQVRNFYKNDNIVSCGKVNLDDLSPENIRKINRQVINTRGEIFFSKLLVFCEGETEEQAMPIFAEHYFSEKCNKTPVEMGIDFVGVSGFGNYSPFLKFAEAFGIPWLIFSDADSNAGSNIKESVQQQFRNCNCKQDENNVIIFLNDGNNFEKQLIADGYGEEIKNVILSFDEYQNEHHRNAKEEKRKEEVNQYNDEKLYKVITDAKTQFGPVIAEEIIKSGKGLPPKVIALFQKIEQLFCHQEAS
jgi:putative ATP-dependent endonuclease of OLD family